MKIQEKVVEFPNRRNVVELDVNGDEVRNFVADINVDETLQGEVTIAGTPMDSALMEQLNGRTDKSLEFKVLEPADEEPMSKADAVQIFTRANGKTYLLPAGGNMDAFEIGRPVDPNRVTAVTNNTFMGENTFAQGIKIGSGENAITISWNAVEEAIIFG